MPTSPPPAGTGQEEVEMVPGEASLPPHAAETAAGAPSASEDQADGEEGDAAEEDGGGGSDDSDTEVGQEEDEESEDSDYSSGSGSSQESNEERFGADTDEFDMALENLRKKVEKGRGGVKHTSSAPAVASCCVCMEPWTSDGAHRICCIPCGHVYGRSCLEKWLRRCGGAVAKCPQCGESFEHERIINLHGTEYLWNDCIHDQERSHLVSEALDQLKETNKKCLETEKRTLAIERMVVRVDQEMTTFKCQVASVMVTMANMMISEGDDDAFAPTPDRMLEFMSRNWPELPRSLRGLSSTLDT